MRSWITPWRAASILFVLVAYVFFGTTGTMQFRTVKWQDSMYADLAEGFLRGQVALASEPGPELRALPNPYLGKNRQDVPYIWDASFHEGRYYLYFSPLPVLLFVIPFFTIARAYPPESLATVVFAGWAFIACTVFILRARLGERWRIPAPLWIVMLGLGGFVPYVLTVAGAPYQVAVSCGMAMTATWAVALLAYLERPTPWRAAFVALWLGLAIAARPNLAPLVVVAAAVLWRHTAAEQRVRHFVVWLLPLGAIAIGLMSYNFVRFGDPMEFGVRYQLGADLIGDRICGLASGTELVRFVNMLEHHVFQPPSFGGGFPWVDLPWSRVDVQVSAGSEQSGGIAAVTPLTLVATVLLFIGYGQNRGAGGVAASYLMLGSWVILLSVATCWFVATRYSLDYALLMTSATIVSLESLMAAEAPPRATRLRIVAVAMVIYSVVVGSLLGFAGPFDAFKSRNPRLLGQIKAALPGAPRPITEAVRLRGWAVHLEGPLQLSIHNPDGTPTTGARVSRSASPDVYEHFAKRWKPFPPLRHARFDIYSPSLDTDLVLSFRGSVVQRVRLRSWPAVNFDPRVRVAVDGFEVTRNEN